MEYAPELNDWLFRMLDKAKSELGVSDDTMAYSLIKKGLDYLRATSKLKMDEDFICWLDETLRDGKKKLHLTNLTLMDVCLKQGFNYYMRTISRAHLGIEEDLHGPKTPEAVQYDRGGSVTQVG